MRTVIINDGDILQIDLVPENEHEISVLAAIKVGTELRVGKSSGYGSCQGGHLLQFQNDQARKFTFITNHPETTP